MEVGRSLELPGQQPNLFVKLQVSETLFQKVEWEAAETTLWLKHLLGKEKGQRFPNLCKCWVAMTACMQFQPWRQRRGFCHSRLVRQINHVDEVCAWPCLKRQGRRAVKEDLLNLHLCPSTWEHAFIHTHIYHIYMHMKIRNIKPTSTKSKWTVSEDWHRAYLLIDTCLYI